MEKFEVEFYETETGRQPAKEFLLSLDKKMRAKMLHMISILQDNGNELREHYSKHLSDGIFELRAKVGSDIRLCWQKNIVLTICSEGRTSMSVKFDDFLQEQLQDPELKKEYEALQPEHAIIQAIINARQQSGLTQKELSERTGIAQGDISKLERGNANPSIRTLQRLAAGMGMRLRLEFIPDAAATFVTK